MSVACQSWEVASGPTMGYDMAIQNTYVVSELLPSGASGYNASTLGSSESFLKAIASSSDMSNCLIPSSSKVLMPPDNVIRGFSSLALHSPQENEAGDCKSRDLNPPQRDTPGSAPPFLNPTDFVQRLAHGGFENNGRFSSPCTTLPQSSSLAMGSFCDAGHGYSSTYNNSKHKLDVVVEDKALEDGSTTRVCEDMADYLEVSLSSSSTHSTSSLHDTIGDGGTSSGDGSSSTGEAEVQSEYRGFTSSSIGASPPKKGLSRFYAGKSRSFSCLGDVVSLKDLGKPENPYAKKRKCNVGRSLNGRSPQLPPLQKGAASISKKLPSSGKSTLAFAVAMTAKDDENNMRCGVFEKCAGVERRQGGPFSSRSYSLSDLQGVTNRYIFPS